MLEKEIESRFIDWAIQKTYIDNGPRQYKYLGRQVKLPMGIADVLLFNRDACRAGIDVVEVKREAATISALAQVLGYVGQVDEMVERFCSGPNGEHWIFGLNMEWGNTRPVIVAPDIDGYLMERCFKADIFDFIKVVQNGIDITFEQLYGVGEPLGKEDDSIFRGEVYSGYVASIQPAFDLLREYRWHKFE